MKKYQKISESNWNQMKQEQLKELRLFQFLLRNNSELNVRYHFKAREIADGLQPWIDALELALKKEGC